MKLFHKNFSNIVAGFYDVDAVWQLGVLWVHLPVKSINGIVVGTCHVNAPVLHDGLRLLWLLCRNYARAASLLLRSGGRFCICLRPERLCDAMHAMRCYRLEPKRLRLVAKNSESAPWLCLLEGRRDGKSGLQILPGLFLYTKDGALYAEMQRLQQPYSEQGGVDE